MSTFELSLCGKNTISRFVLIFILFYMHIIAYKNLQNCWHRHPDSKGPLSNWYKIAKTANWKNTSEIQKTFPYVSVLSNNRVVFNIKGNDYRLVVAFQFQHGIGYICFVGTHDEYNKINANEIWDY